MVNHHLKTTNLGSKSKAHRFGQETFEARPHETFLFYFSGSGMETQAGAKGFWARANLFWSELFWVSDLFYPFYNRKLQVKTCI